MVIDPVHAISVIEKRGSSECPVSQHSMEPSIEASGKGGILLVEVDEISGANQVELMPFFLKTTRGLRIGKLLARKNQNNVPSFVVERHSFRRGIFSCHPPHISPQGFIDPDSSFIKGLVTKRLNHAQKLGFGPFPGHLGKKTNDSWHIVRRSKAAFQVDMVIAQTIILKVSWKR
jgi:hypothetical protein